MLGVGLLATPVARVFSDDELEQLRGFPEIEQTDLTSTRTSPVQSHRPATPRGGRWSTTATPAPAWRSWTTSLHPVPWVSRGSGPGGRLGIAGRKTAIPGSRSASTTT